MTFSARTTSRKLRMYSISRTWRRPEPYPVERRAADSSDNCPACRPVAQFRECGHHLSVRRERNDRGRGHVHESALSGSDSGSGLVRFESQGGSAFYALPRVEGALPRCELPVSETAVVSDAGPERDSDSRNSRFLHALSVEEVLDLHLWWPAILGHRSAILPSARTTPLPGSRSWKPAGGASMNWQGQFTSVAVSYSHMISSGGGLIGAVQMDAATASFRQQLTRSLSASVSGGYAQSTVLGGLSQTVGEQQRTHAFREPPPCNSSSAST